MPVRILVILMLLAALAGAAAADPAADVREARLAVAAGEVERALELYRRAAADPTADAAADALAGLCAYSPDADEVVAAASALLEHHRDHPEAAHATELLADLRAARGEYRSAARLFASAAAGSAGDERGRLLVQQGRALLGAGEAAEARDVFDAAGNASKSPELAAAALLGRGDAFLLEQNNAAAREAYQDYLERFPDTDYEPVVLSQLVRVVDAEGDTPAANDLLRRLVEKHPDSIEAANARDRLRRAARAAERPVSAAAVGEETARGHYSLQVGAFGSEANAQELARKLIDLGLPDVRIEREQRNDRLFYRVRVGAYRDPEEAEAAGRALRAEHGLACQVVVR